MWPSWVSTMTPSYRWPTPEALEEWSPISSVTSCFLKSNWDLYYFFCRPVLAIGRTWFGLTDSRMYAFMIAKSKKNQNNHMYHLVLDLRVRAYNLRIWSAKSTPPMFWLYNLTARGHATSMQLPSGNRRDTTSMRTSLQMVSTTCTGFLSFQTKQWTFLARTCVAMFCPLSSATTRDLANLGYSFLLAATVPTQ